MSVKERSYSQEATNEEHVGSISSRAMGPSLPPSTDLKPTVLLAISLDGSVTAVSRNGAHLWTSRLGNDLISSYQEAHADNLDFGNFDEEFFDDESSDAFNETEALIIPGRDGSIMLKSSNGLHRLKYRIQELVNHLPFSAGTNLLVGSKITSVYEVSLITGDILSFISGVDDRCPPRPDLSDKGNGDPTIWLGRTDYVMRAYDRLEQKELWNISFSEVKSPDSYILDSVGYNGGHSTSNRIPPLQRVFQFANDMSDTYALAASLDGNLYAASLNEYVKYNGVPNLIFSEKLGSAVPLASVIAVGVGDDGFRAHVPIGFREIWPTISDDIEGKSTGFSYNTLFMGSLESGQKYALPRTPHTLMVSPSSRLSMSDLSEKMETPTTEPYVPAYKTINREKMMEVFFSNLLCSSVGKCGLPGVAAADQPTLLLPAPGTPGSTSQKSHNNPHESLSHASPSCIVPGFYSYSESTSPFLLLGPDSDVDLSSLSLPDGVFLQSDSSSGQDVISGLSPVLLWEAMWNLNNQAALQAVASPGNGRHPNDYPLPGKGLVPLYPQNAVLPTPPVRLSLWDRVSLEPNPLLRGMLGISLMISHGTGQNPQSLEAAVVWSSFLVLFSFITLGTVFFLRYRRKKNQFLKQQQALSSPDLANLSSNINTNENGEEKGSEEDLILKAKPVPPGFKRISPRLAVNLDIILGYGSHGTTVFEGRWDARSVAVKRMLRSFHPTAEREIGLLVKTDGHPNVVRYYSMEEKDEFLYLALELCSESLNDALEKAAKSISLQSTSDGMNGSIDTSFNHFLGDNEPQWKADCSIPTPPTRAFMKSIVEGVVHLHRNRIAHRDLKPHNILLAKYRDEAAPTLQQFPTFQTQLYPLSEHHSLGLLFAPKISDFGLSKQLSIDSSSLGAQLGRPVDRDRTSLGMKETLNRSKLLSSSSTGSIDVSSSGGAHGAGSIGWQAPEVLVLGLLYRHGATYRGASPGALLQRLLLPSTTSSPTSASNQNFDNPIIQNTDSSSSSPSVDLTAQENDPLPQNGSILATFTGEKQRSEHLVGTVRVADVSSWRVARASDIWSLGCILYCVLLPGRHPFGSIYEREAQVVAALEPRGTFGQSTPLVELASVPEARLLLSHMLRLRPADRPLAPQVAAHPLFWSDSDRTHFLSDLSDFIEGLDTADPARLLFDVAAAGGLPLLAAGLDVLLLALLKVNRIAVSASSNVEKVDFSAPSTNQKQRIVDLLQVSNNSVQEKEKSVPTSLSVPSHLLENLTSESGGIVDFSLLETTWLKSFQSNLEFLNEQGLLSSDGVNPEASPKIRSLYGILDATGMQGFQWLSSTLTGKIDLGVDIDKRNAEETAQYTWLWSLSPSLIGYDSIPPSSTLNTEKNIVETTTTSFSLSRDVSSSTLSSQGSTGSERLDYAPRTTKLGPKMEPLSWNQRLPPTLVQEMTAFRKYDFSRASDLLRLLRNMRAHFKELSAASKDAIGSHTESAALVPFLLSNERFPGLLAVAYLLVLAFFAHEPLFAPYLGRENVAEFGESSRTRLRLYRAKWEADALANQARDLTMTSSLTSTSKSSESDILNLKSEVDSSPFVNSGSSTLGKFSRISANAVPFTPSPASQTSSASTVGFANMRQISTSTSVEVLEAPYFHTLEDWSSITLEVSARALVGESAGTLVAPTLERNGTIHPNSSTVHEVVEEYHGSNPFLNAPGPGEAPVVGVETEAPVDTSSNLVLCVNAHSSVKETKFKGGAHVSGSKYKSNRCEDWFSSGALFCPRGARCDFAHGLVELRDRNGLGKFEDYNEIEYFPEEFDIWQYINYVSPRKNIKEGVVEEKPVESPSA